MSIRMLGATLLALGFDPRKLLRSVRGLPNFSRSLIWLWRISRRGATDDFKILPLPILSDATANSGVARGHYFHQDLWAARRIHDLKPTMHVDVGSRVDGFVAHVLTFMSVTVIDVRPLISTIPGLKFIQRDMMAEDGGGGISSESVSCLHALEHFGLGRYGDPLDWDGWRKGLINVATMVSPGGRLYLSVPIGPQVVEFNAQRIFSPQTVIEAANKLDLYIADFSFIDDRGDFHPSVDIEKASACRYGCGCFEFLKSNLDNADG